MSATALEAWEKLNRRIRLSYYIGKPDVALIDAELRGAVVNPTPAPPSTVGLDVDNDGEVDATYTRND